MASFAISKNSNWAYLKISQQHYQIHSDKK